MDSDSNTSWKYRPGGASAPPDENTDAPTDPSEPPSSKASVSGDVTWTAAEFIDHEQGASWYALLFLGTVATSVAVYFATREYFAVGTFVVLGFIVAYLAGHKPRQIDYELSSKGVRIGEKEYRYSQFKSFSVAHEGLLSSINLAPLKRFMPPIALYFEPKEEERIVNALGEHLPYEDRKMDLTDRLARRLRF